MDYIINSILPKSKYVHNKYYPMITGRGCNILHLEPQRQGELLIDTRYDPGNPHRFWTTPVRDIRELSDGTVVFETENSVYTLVPLRKYHAEENHD